MTPETVDIRSRNGPQHSKLNELTEWTDEWSEWTGSQIRAMRRDTIQVNTADIHLKSNCGL
jgi:hypothetical protein